MKFKLVILSIGLIIIGVASCTKEWDEYYNVYPETVNQNV